MECPTPAIFLPGQPSGGTGFPFVLQTNKRSTSVDKLAETLTPTAYRLARWHAIELEGLLERVDPSEPGYESLRSRTDEAWAILGVTVVEEGE